MKVCLTGAAGGHLTQLLQLEDFYKKYEYFFLTFKSETTGKLDTERVHFIQNPKRNPVSFLINIIQSILILLKENPDVIITTGGGVSIAICYVGKLFYKKIVCIESLSRVETPSLTGKILYPVSDLFLVQWKSLLDKYGSKAVYGGRII